MSKEVRRGIVKAEYNSGAFGVLAIEVAVIAIIAGFYFKSWWIGGGTYIGLFFLLDYQAFGVIYMAMMSIVWAYIGFALASIFAPISGQIVVGIISFIIGVGVHFSAIEYVGDMSYHER